MGAVAPPTLITVAPTGAETAKADAPALPVTLDELVATAQACEAAGAGLIHVHIRDDDAQPTLDLAGSRTPSPPLREATGLVVQLSTGGAVTDPFEARLAVLDAEPDSCSLTCGTVNFGADVFLNPWPFMVELYRRTQELEVVPEFELFDLGHVTALNRLLDKDGPPYGGQVHCDLVMGVPGGMPGTTGGRGGDGRATCRRGPPGRPPASAVRPCPVALAALSAGGHLRVGMEDTLTSTPGQPVRDNAQLVERAATLATLAQRPPMTTDEARALLNVKDRRKEWLHDQADARGTPSGRPGARRRLPRRPRRALARRAARAPRTTPSRRRPTCPTSRRMLQGRMDIIEAELRRREPGSTERRARRPPRRASSPTSRAAPTASAGSSRVEPSRVDEHRREVEQIVADAAPVRRRRPQRRRARARPSCGCAGTSARSATCAAGAARRWTR